MAQICGQWHVGRPFVNLRAAGFPPPMTDLPPPPGSRIAAALDYWHHLRGDRRMPARGEIDPTRIHALLPYLLLVDVLRAPQDFRYRLVGAEIDAISHRRFRGVRFSEVVHMRQGNRLWAQYAEVAAGRRPLWSEIPYVGADPFIRHMQHILLPLSSDGETVDTVLAAVDINRAALAA